MSKHLSTCQSSRLQPMEFMYDHSFLRVILCISVLTAFANAGETTSSISLPAVDNVAEMPPKEPASTSCLSPPCVAGTFSEKTPDLGSFVDKNEGEELQLAENREGKIKDLVEDKLRIALKGLVRALRRRVRKLRDSGKLNYDQKQFRELGCLALATPSVPQFSGVVALYPSAFLARLTVSLPLLDSLYGSVCRGQVTPLAINLHSKSNPAIPRNGSLNLDNICNEAFVGGVYSHCGQEGSSMGRSFWEDYMGRSLAGCADEAEKKHSSMRRLSLASPIAYQSCNPGLYRLRPFACKAGHFSGKFGLPQDVSHSAISVDLRILALDRHAENPCFIAEGFFPLVLSCAGTGHAIACVPFRRLETLMPQEVLGTLDILLEETESSTEIIRSNQQMQAFISIVSELEARVNFLEASMLPSPRILTEGKGPPPRGPPMIVSVLSEAAGSPL